MSFAGSPLGPRYDRNARISSPQGLQIDSLALWQPIPSVSRPADMLHSLPLTSCAYVSQWQHGTDNCHVTRVRPGPERSFCRSSYVPANAEIGKLE